VNLAAVEIKAFVPAADFALTKEFYVALGFEVPWSSVDLAYVRHGETIFLLHPNAASFDATPRKCRKMTVRNSRIVDGNITYAHS